MTTGRANFAFWRGLYERKLRVWQMSDGPWAIRGFHSAVTDTIEVRGGSFADPSELEEEDAVRHGEDVVMGELRLVSSFPSEPSSESNSSFQLYVVADIKNYEFQYVFHTGTAALPRSINLRSALDRRELAESAAQLNICLMRWRMLPELQQELLRDTRVLLIGAGTLGCHVARDLLAWGFRTITFVDNGRVSYSNPVRQPLFDFADAEAAAWKADAATCALRRIHPTVNTAAHVIDIPSPGHLVDAAAAAAAVTELNGLISDHDVVFLLTDTRESRWLPTLLARAQGRPVITAALGFDTWLVMRHGSGSGLDPAPLGCYYCTDCVAPRNSTTGRSLDQQCTVTRPGVAPIAAALAVELLVATLHHPAGFAAPPDAAAPVTESTTSPLGLVPHQIRGFLSHIQPMIGAVAANPVCPACSDAVVTAMREGGIDFLLHAIRDSAFLENVSGLTAAKEALAEHLDDSSF
jgi:ubiquitin-like modifier-activating enzyme ATG7